MFPSPSSIMPPALILSLVLATGCSAPEQSADEASGAASAGSDAAAMAPAPLVQLLADGQVLFGIFPGPSTREQGALMGQNRDLDFVFYSLESGPFDIMSTKVYMEGIAEGSGTEAPHPLVLRVPPIRNSVEQAGANVAEALDAGVAAIVFPHVESAEDAAVAVSVMGADLWPGNPDGTLLSILIVEDRSGVERVDEIVSTPGVSIVFAGPGDLRRAYAGRQGGRIAQKRSSGRSRRCWLLASATASRAGSPLVRTISRTGSPRASGCSS